MHIKYPADELQTNVIIRPNKAKPDKIFCNVPSMYLLRDYLHLFPNWEQVEMHLCSLGHEKYKQLLQRT